jgi:di/tricarboxylate transporter
LRAGDVLLIEGDEKLLPDVVSDLGCLPLVDRKLTLEPRRLALPALLFAVAIGLTAADVAPAMIAFTAAALLLVVLQVLRPAEAYQSIDWPVIVLLGAMIPVGGALETTGTADLLAQGVADLAGDLGAYGILAIVLVATMVLTPLLNNAATVVIMAPIAISIARAMDSSADPFLMAVAIGASCDFLTPFGHQNNTLILGPGGYRFADYWRMGLPLELIIIAASLAILPIVWPFAQ